MQNALEHFASILIKMNINVLEYISEQLPKKSEKMPVLFLGHGSPMNTIEENQFVRGFREISKKKNSYSQCYLCISAHWYTKGTYVTSGENAENDS